MSEELKPEQNEDCYALTASIVRQVRAHMNSYYADIKTTMNTHRKYCRKKIKEIQECSMHIDHMWELVRKKEEELKKIESALNDRTDNLQKIYDRMVVIENKLKPFDQIYTLLDKARGEI